MEIILNGKKEFLEKETGLIDFLELKELECNRVVVEYNYQVINSERWEEITLKDQDVLEVLRFVGGG